MAKKLKKITEKVLLDAVKACADHYMRTELKTGRGFPDCLVRHNDLTFFVEVKAPGDRESPRQKVFRKTYGGITIFFEGKRLWLSANITSDERIDAVEAMDDLVDSVGRYLLLKNYCRLSEERIVASA